VDLDHHRVGPVGVQGDVVLALATAFWMALSSLSSSYTSTRLGSRLRKPAPVSSGRALHPVEFTPSKYLFSTQLAQLGPLDAPRKPACVVRNVAEGGGIPVGMRTPFEPVGEVVIGVAVVGAHACGGLDSPAAGLGVFWVFLLWLS
jgi:hypothetical protein